MLQPARNYYTRVQSAKLDKQALSLCILSWTNQKGGTLIFYYASNAMRAFKSHSVVNTYGYA